jgi:D-3-phosphoglycerate dehydrogenase
MAGKRTLRNKAAMKDATTEKALLERPAILILDAPPAGGEPERETLAAAGIEAELLAWGGGDAAADREALERADFILTWRVAVDEAMVRQARRCLAIFHYGPGAGRGVAPVALEAARQTGIYVASVPDAATASWVEETIRLITLLTRDTPELPVRKLAGLRLGLVGFGQVGRRVAQWGRERKMEVWACDPFAPDEPFATAGVRRADLVTLFGVADIVSLHLPLGPGTRGLIGAEPFMVMKPNALLINTSDPELVDPVALGEALERGRPLAAAFDEELGGALADRRGLLHGARRAGVGEGWNAACRRRVAGLVASVLYGNRPDHLLIDPPCPRHILALAGKY